MRKTILKKPRPVQEAIAPRPKGKQPFPLGNISECQGEDSKPAKNTKTHKSTGFQPKVMNECSCQKGETCLTCAQSASQRICASSSHLSSAREQQWRSDRNNAQVAGNVPQPEYCIPTWQHADAPLHEQQETEKSHRHTSSESHHCTESR